MIYEQASVVNCSQDFFTSNTEHWIFAWLLISTVSSLVFLVIIRLNHEKLNYPFGKARKIYKKGCFGSLIFLLVTSSVYYVMRFFTKSDEMGKGISILLFLWPFLAVAVTCCVNYLPRVHWTETIAPRFTTLVWWKDCLTKNSNFIIYWVALAMYFVETTCKLLSVMLDLAYDVVPLIQSRFSDDYGQFWGVMMIVIGFRLGFHARLQSFFWEKLFHGEYDLFAEPSDKLLEEPLEKKQQNNELEKDVELEEMVCT